MTLKIEYLFRTCCEANDLVTSFIFIVICHATMLCHFDHLRNSFVFTHSFHSTSAATGTATSEYWIVPERIGQNEEPASRNWKRTRDKASPTPKLFATEAQSDGMYT